MTPSGNKRIRQVRQGLRRLTVGQLVALASQKRVMMVSSAVDMAGADMLVGVLEHVDGILTPVRA